MNGRDLGNAVGGAIVGLLIVAVFLAVTATAAVIYGAPWLWSLIKPWLHAITA